MVLALRYCILLPAYCSIGVKVSAVLLPHYFCLWRWISIWRNRTHAFWFIPPSSLDNLSCFCVLLIHQTGRSVGGTGESSTSKVIMENTCSFGNYNHFRLEGSNGIDWPNPNSESIRQNSKDIFNATTCMREPVVENLLALVQLSSWVWPHYPGLQTKGLICYNIIRNWEVAPWQFFWCWYV